MLKENVMTDDLLVQYPYGGKKILLQWYDYNEGHNVILASCEENMLGIVQRLVPKYPDMTAKEYCEVDIVAPPERLCKLAAKQSEKDRIELFCQNIAYRVKSLCEAGHILPPTFSLCTTYVASDGGGEDEDDHFLCKNCHDTIHFVGMTDKEFYERYYDAWQKFFPEISSEKVGVISQAARATDDEVIHCADINFVHHSFGVSLDKIQPPNPIPTNPLFFFRRLREIDPKEIVAVIDAAKKAKQEKTRENAKTYEAKVKQEKEKLTANILKLFGGK